MNAYYAQWDLSEFDLVDDYLDDDLDGEGDDDNAEDDGECCCSGCMDCLGLSWSDFA